MRLTNLNLKNFKGFESCDLNIDGRSTVIFGVNGTGKTSILEAINYLCWNWLYRLNPAQGTAFKSLDGSLVRTGTSKLEISGEFEFDGKEFLLKKEYTKARPGKGTGVSAHKKLYDAFVEQFLSAYGDEDKSIPIFVNYGTNRSVLDIPLRIRKKHEFSKWTAIERANENKLDYRTFFEWFRNQEDYEAEIIREKQDFSYTDIPLQCVRTAVQAMLPEFGELQVKRNPLRLAVKKNGVEYSVDQLSDGEKCTLALIGDLARRLALANQNSENPLAGSGIVLIDEIELGEVSNQFNLFMLSENEERQNIITPVNRMDGFDSNFILEEYMDTASSNPEFRTMVNRTFQLIDDGQFDKSTEFIKEIQEIVGMNNPVVIELEGYLKRRKLIYEKNH